jgi:hypothetical protein
MVETVRASARLVAARAGSTGASLCPQIVELASTHTRYFLFAWVSPARVRSSLTRLNWRPEPSAFAVDRLRNTVMSTSGRPAASRRSSKRSARPLSWVSIRDCRRASPWIMWARSPNRLGWSDGCRYARCTVGSDVVSAWSFAGASPS